MTTAVRLDNAEHLPLSPPALNKRGDLSPPFISNVTSMYNLLVTELEKMVEPTVWENPWGFSGDQGTLSWQLEPKKTSFSSRCQCWGFWIVSPEGWEEIHIWFNWDWRPSGFPEYNSASFVHTHRKTHVIQKRPKFRSAAQIHCTHNASMSGSDYYVVWLQVQSDLLADDERERNRATDREKEQREIPFKLKGWISSPHTSKHPTRGRQTRISFVLYQVLVIGLGG